MGLAKKWAIIRNALFMRGGTQNCEWADLWSCTSNVLLLASLRLQTRFRELLLRATYVKRIEMYVNKCALIQGCLY